MEIWRNIGIAALCFLSFISVHLISQLYKNYHHEHIRVCHDSVILHVAKEYRLNIIILSF